MLGHEAGPTKEIALLKAAAESLRAGLREKEDSITELVSDLLATFKLRCGADTNQLKKKRTLLFPPNKPTSEEVVQWKEGGVYSPMFFFAVGVLRPHHST